MVIVRFIKRGGISCLMQMIDNARLAFKTFSELFIIYLSGSLIMSHLALYACIVFCKVCKSTCMVFLDYICKEK